MAEQITHKRTTPTKKRSQSCYNKKVERVKAWYLKAEQVREKEVINPNTNKPVQRKDLKPLDYYIEKIKKPAGDNK
jgi:hypothetical protein